MSRKRKIFASALTVVALALVSACSGGGSSGSSGKFAGNSARFPASVYPKSIFGNLSGQLFWYDTSGGIVTQARDVYWKDFTALTGVPNQVDYTDGTTTKLFNAVQQGGSVPWNMGEITGAQFYVAKSKGWLEPINTKVVPVGDLQPGQFDKYGIRMDLFGTLVFWNTKAFPKDKQPADASALLDTKDYPGKRCFPKNFEDTAEIILQAAGVKPADIYPINVPLVFKLLDKIKSDIIWWTQADVATSNMINGECTIGITYSGRVYNAIEKSHYPLNATWKGSVSGASWYVVPKGATDPKVGQAAISMALRDKHANLSYVNAMTYPIYLKTIPLTDYNPGVQKWLAVGKNAAQGVEEDGQWYAEHPNIETQFANWLVGS